MNDFRDVPLGTSSERARELHERALWHFVSFYGDPFAAFDATIAAMHPEGRSPFDFLLSPTAPMPAYAAELAGPTNDPATPFEHIAFTLPFNMSEQPAASINCGYTAGGQPIGLQIVGPRFNDLGVLQVARAYEQMRPAQRAWPQAPAQPD